MSITTIQHQGKQIIFVDYTACITTEALITKLYQAEQFILNQPEKVLTVADVTGTSLNAAFMKEAKELAKRSMNDRVAKGALLGVTGLKKALLLGFNVVATIKWMPFDTKEEAMDYLVK